MKYTVDLYCKCGQVAKYDFATEGAREEYTALFNKQHAGEGHELITRTEYLQLKRARAFAK